MSLFLNTAPSRTIIISIMFEDQSQSQSLLYTCCLRTNHNLDHYYIGAVWGPTTISIIIIPVMSEDQPQSRSLFYPCRLRTNHNPDHYYVHDVWEPATVSIIMISIVSEDQTQSRSLLYPWSRLLLYPWSRLLLYPWYRSLLRPWCLWLVSVWRLASHGWDLGSVLPEVGGKGGRSVYKGGQRLSRCLSSSCSTPGRSYHTRQGGQH